VLYGPFSLSAGRSSRPMDYRYDVLGHHEPNKSFEFLAVSCECKME
jgi:hypothetical protein